MHQMFQMMARYNRWANAKLYDAAQALPDAAYREERGAFFGSVHGTLNHLVVTDRIWMHRFTGDGPTHARLEERPYRDLPTLRAAREVVDERIVAWTEGLDPATLTGTFTYRPVTNPRDITQPLAPAMMHFFNHQAHHLGQVHCLLTQLAGEAPSLDLIYYQRETGDGLA
ncbi:DinB family protein [Lutibaculum baratangense]|uniref:DinB family protein n=1 Tax=Lutibaculum baratangense AMV1 TaxID=631454 RepID=V4TNC2_9HYPH|nr:DinB family protein [Lutibaculum baratangense]ESR27218.1 hypothetical protein N177_0197 [Lutibaculum baratangense AMV1]